MRVLVHGNRFKFKAVWKWLSEILKYFLNPADCKFRAIDWGRNLGNDMRQAADMIQVPVGDDISFEFIFDAFKVGGVGNSIIDTRQIDTQVVAAVQYDSIVHVFNQDHVFGAGSVHARSEE